MGTLPHNIQDCRTISGADQRVKCYDRAQRCHEIEKWTDRVSCYDVMSGWYNSADEADESDTGTSKDVAKATTKKLTKNNDYFNETEVRRHCSVEWSNNFDMQNFCLETHKQGYNDFIKVGIKYKKNDALMFSLATCKEEWFPQWDMVNFCSDSQIKGWEALNN